MNETLQKKEAQLSEVLAASNLDPNMLGAVSKKLDDVLDSKNGAIKDLQYELSRVTKVCAHTMVFCRGHGRDTSAHPCDLKWPPRVFLERRLTTTWCACTSPSSRSSVSRSRSLDSARY